MRTVLASSTVLLTILLSLSFGIACGYVMIAAILRAFAHRPVQTQSAPAAVPVVAASAGMR